MRTFNVTAAWFKEGIDYTYNQNGLLVGLSIKENLKPEATQKVIDELPSTLEAFLAWVQTKKNVTVVEVHQAITFEMFWKKYNEPRSSKKRTLVKWNKMPEAEQIKAFLYIDTYERNRGNAEKKYAETFLNAELWNN